MKTLSFFKSVFSALLFISLFASCGENQGFLGEDEASITPGNTTSNARAGACFITPAVVQGNTCGAPTYGNLYTLYVTGGRCPKVYDRQVTVTIFHDNSLLQQRTVTIPANQTLSNHVSVFSNATESYGTVRLQVSSVIDMSTNQPDTSCTMREVSPTVNNCYNSSGTGHGDGGGSGDDGFDPCNGHDVDEDGICDHEDDSILDNDPWN